MRDVVEIMAKYLVANPDQITLKEYVTGSEVVYELSVAQEDMGRIIGKHGRIAKAMRTVLKAAATKQKQFVTLEIVDPVTSEQEGVQ
ncbi:MAG: KH domain-containing protein [Symbiobacteriaceae bacterium]|nr:KH domain-containing protein [Symbiobacteriaceae bacterium]